MVNQTTFSNNDTITAAIAGNNVNLREKPSIDSRSIAQLLIGTRVKIIKTSNDIIKIGNQTGKWVLIETYDYDQKSNSYVRGWIFNYYLTNGRMIKINEWPFKSLQACCGDHCPTYNFYSNGSYTVKYQILWLGGSVKGKYSGHELEKQKCVSKTGKIVKTGDADMCVINGHLYRYLNIIWAKEYDDYLLINQNNELCLPCFGICEK